MIRKLSIETVYTNLCFQHKSSTQENSKYFVQGDGHEAYRLSYIGLFMLSCRLAWRLIGALDAACVWYRR